MSETTVLLLGIVLVALALGVSAVPSLARVAPPAPVPPAPGVRPVLPVTVVCPTTGDLAFAEIGFDWGTGELAVATCERFPGGEFECERECFPTQVLVPVGHAAAPSA